MAESQNGTAILSDKWFVKYDNGDSQCIKECEEGTEANCGGQAEDYKEMYGSFKECCTFHTWWLSCATYDENGAAMCDPGFWESYFLTNPEVGYVPDGTNTNCVKSGDTGGDKSQAECCYTNFPSPDEYRTCMGDPEAVIPCTLPSLSGNWYVQYTTAGDPKCVKECIGADADCGGQAEDYEELYESFDACCKFHLWWLPDSPCQV